MRKTVKYFVISVMSLAVIACGEADKQAAQTLQATQGVEELVLTGRTMGPIVYTVKVVGEKQRVEQQMLAENVDKLLKKINAQMSTYDAESELSKFNRYQGMESRNISAELDRVLTESIRLAKITDGAFDVTVGPLVNLWSFGPEKRPESVPAKELIASTKQHIGINKISLEGGKLAKNDVKVYVDLSAIAKGFAVDMVADYLEQQGYNDYIVDIGGEMRLKGNKLSGKDWRIAVEKPISGTRAVQKVIIPGDNAVATSGDYRNYFEEDGVRYSHTIDPDTGWPIDHKLVSVTVLHPSAMTADGLATAIEVMGPDKGLAFAEQQNVAVYLISKSDDGFTEQMTEQFKQYLAEK
ncbi:FAD:protein FMN transferase [Thalassotalea sp. HSM 43]|uniref:FAD:protein FMN transferase n=1 Tax=Thalassotalea sp. HSM 43 TaxID=2552945 RepID=UPI001081BDF9|nr:FAD:protein FMN transferase [Thalassotalea sp. HSM 43]QBY05129.1 FAD:protein FMN transferase [Thalassotalea sp. HSM 43]